MVDKSYPHSIYVINRNSPEITVFTDASKTGWGGVTECGDRAGDNWTPSEVKSHINFLELLAVFHSLKAFNDKLEGQHVKIMCDNTTAVCCINHIIWELAIQNAVMH